MISTTLAELGVAAWLTAGAALGVFATAAYERLRAWREARIASEWDPY